MEGDTLVSLKDACERLGGISRPTLYKMFDEKKIATVAIGRRRFIPSSEITKYIERSSTQPKKRGVA